MIGRIGSLLVALLSASSCCSFLLRLKTKESAEKSDKVDASTWSSSEESEEDPSKEDPSQDDPPEEPLKLRIFPMEEPLRFRTFPMQERRALSPCPEDSEEVRTTFQ